MTQRLEEWNIGDTLELGGRIGKIEAIHDVTPQTSNYRIRWEDNGFQDFLDLSLFPKAHLVL